MDFLLIFYSLILALFFLSPFFYAKIVKKNHIPSKEDFQNIDPLWIKRNLLLENLKDLKYEHQTGKSSILEFDEIASPIISELKQIDEVLGNGNISNPKLLIEQLPDAKLLCNACTVEIPLKHANFCPHCGKQLSETRLT
ncbi:MAG: zinc ribbon domain-containing protein [Leptospiraceae bacterium]|nr:zinc ribbon domain-containing protein [Leptospiraceae bacterium]